MSSARKKTLIRYSPQAIERIQRLHSYIAEELCNQEAARKAVGTIRKTIGYLEMFPEMGQLLSGVRDDIPQELHKARFLVKNMYVILYIYEEGVVSILDVFHTLENIFGRLLSGYK